jgi:hypothetical protein
MTKRVKTTIAMSVSLLAPMLLTMDVVPVNVSLATMTPSSTQNHTNNYLTGQSHGEEDGKVGVYDPPGSYLRHVGNSRMNLNTVQNIFRAGKFGKAKGPLMPYVIYVEEHTVKIISEGSMMFIFVKNIQKVSMPESSPT